MVRYYEVRLRVEIKFEKRFLPMGFICSHLCVALQMLWAALDTVHTIHHRECSGNQWSGS